MSKHKIEVEGLPIERFLRVSGEGVTKEIIEFLRKNNKTS